MIDVIPIVQLKGDEGQNQGCDNGNGGKKQESNSRCGSTSYFSEMAIRRKRDSHLYCFSIQTVFQGNQIALNDVRKLFSEMNCS